MRKGSFWVAGVPRRQLCSGKKEETGLTEVGKGTKRMLVVDGNGIPLAPSISRASRAEVKLAQETLERVRVPRRKGRPRKRPGRLVADKAYDCDRFRGWLRSKGPSIPPRRSREGRRKRWADEYKGRWQVERTFARLDNFRRPMVRWERPAMVYEAFCTLACIIICLRELLIMISTVRPRSAAGTRKPNPKAIAFGMDSGVAK